MLELLDGLRGVAISEKGKVVLKPKEKTVVSEREKERKAQQERVKLMMEKERERENGSPDLGGLADMFG